MNLNLINHIKNNTGLLIRFDDISENMNWDLMDKCEKLFDDYNIKPLVGVIPNNQDKELLKHPIRKDFWNILKVWQSKGWEISMHGYTHVYDKETFKKDFFEYGGKSEFFGHTYSEQKIRIENGINILKKNGLNIRSFFAPNHTYDNNTFEALKSSGISIVIDGYGLFPFDKNQIKFVPQLFYKVFLLPYGIQSTQIHLNYWKENNYKDFEKFIKKNYKKIMTFDEVLKRCNNSKFAQAAEVISRNILRVKRFFI